NRFFTAISSGRRGWMTGSSRASWTWSTLRSRISGSTRTSRHEVRHRRGGRGRGGVDRGGPVGGGRAARRGPGGGGGGDPPHRGRRGPPGMRYDTVVVGAGVAGLTAAVRLAEAGQRVVVLAKGVGSTHLTGATIDILGYAPDRVKSPARALPGFVGSHPDHPYARLSAKAIPESIEWLKSHVAAYRYEGRWDRNFLLPTAVGVPKPTAVAPETM